MKDYRKAACGFLAAISLGFFCIHNPSAFAEGGEGACRGDVEKFCNDVQPGGGRIINCLKQHQSELSDSCKERGEEVKEKIKEKGGEFREACKDDVDRFCKDVKLGEGRIVRCLKDHKDELSASCKKIGAEMKEKREERREKMQARAGEMRDACRDDVQKFCADVKPGEGRIIQCLKQHKDELSDSCKRAGPGRGGRKHSPDDKDHEDSDHGDRGDAGGQDGPPGEPGGSGK